ERGPAAGRRADLERGPDDLRTLAHGDEAEAFRTPRRAYEVEADAVVDDAQRPAPALTPPPDLDRARGRVLVDVLQSLLQHAVDRDLLVRREPGRPGAQVRVDREAEARLVLRRVSPHRLGQAEGRERRRTKI